MKIAVNTRLLLKEKLGGIGWFTYQTLKRIVKDHPEHRFYFIFDRQWNEEFIFADNVIAVKLGPQSRHPFLWYIWFNFSVSRFLNKIRPDLFLSPDGFIPLKSEIPSLAVIHDINFFHLPDNLPFFVRTFYLRYFPVYASKSTRIATVSEYSKSDIVKSYNTNPDKIDVVYNGSDTIFVPLPEEEQKLVRKQYSKGKEYFVFIGSLIPRKNICRLLQAFEEFKQKTGSENKLIIIGAQLFPNCCAIDLHKKMLFKNDVIFTNRIARAEMTKVLASARALVFVSYFEGFGIPLLEAFRCDIPVVAGNKTALPEIGGDAALYVDPFSIKEIADAMAEINSNEELRKELIKAGRIRRDMFTWEKTAQKLWNSIEKTLNDKL